MYITYVSYNVYTWCNFTSTIQIINIKTTLRVQVINVVYSDYASDQTCELVYHGQDPRSIGLGCINKWQLDHKVPLVVQPDYNQKLAGSQHQ
jgi:hypothetical protein